MDDYIKFNNQTAGRDKIFRLIQYCSRIVWYNLDKRGMSVNGVQKAKKLDETLGLMRRLLRFGRVFDTLHSALPVMSTIDDQVIRLTSALSRISSACFMAIDHIVCLHKLGLIHKNCIDAPGWDKTGTRFWLYSIVMGLVRDVYEIMKVYKEACQMRRRKIKGHHHNYQRHRNSHSDEDEHSTRVIIKGLPANLNLTLQQSIISARIITKCVSKHADITIDVVKNICDLFIPLTILGYIRLSPGTIGTLGIVSTIASAIPQINPMLKITWG
ncbi:peroxisomal membrane protein 11B [Folsomia candida]|uniref:peroxisomal membrane protein 11B n=1 Tax=Folsomia candida TaxID=158441 RepID=UPI000B8FB0F8|nr:peroxisomal membrane protein 11B [Folsomia candida]